MNDKPKTYRSGIILAGGKSSRMGQEKGLMLHQGMPFIQHIILALAPITDTITIITSNPKYKQFGYACIADHIPNCGPVGGIYTGLLHSTTTQNIILSCDVPLITTETLVPLTQCDTENYEVTHYTNMPLIGCYNISVVSTFETHIQQQQLRLQKVLSSITTNHIAIPKSIQYTTQNINTLTEYKKAIVCN